jgi:hypothetical protein
MKTKIVTIEVADNDTEADHERFALLNSKLNTHSPLTDSELELLKQEYLEGAVVEMKNKKYHDARSHLKKVMSIEHIQFCRNNTFKKIT